MLEDIAEPRRIVKTPQCGRRLQLQDAPVFCE